MSVALADNPFVTDPMKTLTKIQREALIAIDFYRTHKREGGYWWIGQKRFSAITITKLAEYALIRRADRGFAVATAGHLVITKLEGKGL